MAFIRPGDIHEIRPVGRDLRLMNLAVPAAALASLADRYYGGCGGWPWDESLPEPRIIDLGAEDIERLSSEAESLVTHPPTPLARDRFLLAMLDEVAPPIGPTNAPAGPAWLTEAFARFRQPEHIGRGRHAFIDLAGRSPEHVGRVVRRLYGRALSAVLRGIQLDAAARLLTMTSRDILDVAMDCGFGSLGYFYRCFRARFGTSPRRYRLSHRRQPFE
jgi:AraC family cel operon transcriptional repressor